MSAGEVDDALIFRATFDRSVNADVAAGDPAIYTAKTLKRKQIATGLKSDGVQWRATGGRSGGALQFTRKTDQLVFYKGGDNVPYKATDFQGSVSLWMRLNPIDDLPNGFVDPIQITDKAWNNSSFFVDFDKAQNRDFRLGVFSDLAFWNPQAREFDDIPTQKRPMVTVNNPPFDHNRWTHVVWTWQSFNTSKDGDARLYLNGELHGRIDGSPQQFTWTPANVVIMLGINYVGWIDDLAIFNQALTPGEVTSLRESTRTNPE